MTPTEGTPAAAPGRIEFDPVRRLLWLGGQPVVLGGRAFDLLACFAARPGHTFAPEELVAAAWPGRVVEASNLRVQVNALRKALGVGAITNVPGRGYALAVRVAARAERVAPGLVGRDEALRLLAALAAEHRLVTVVGSGGIGKTRLVRAWWDLATGETGRRAWVDLAPAAVPERAPARVPAPHAAEDRALSIAPAYGTDGLLAAVAAAFDLAEPREGVPWSVAALAAALAGTEPALLVLDSAEPLASVVAAVLPPLLEAVPSLRAVVTSQLPLHLALAGVLRLPPLACPAPGTPLAEARNHGAVALFVARAQGTQPGFALTERTLAPVVELCRRLDGLPLAIELAAARLPTLGLDALLGALDERLHLLTQHPASVPQRQRTLRAALAWTHGLLDERTRAVFARVAVFSSPFTHEAAQQVVADPGPSAALDRWAVLQALQSLFETSLLMPVAGDPPRLRLLETPRLFALEQLRLRGEEPLLRQRHVQWCTAWLNDAAPQRLLEGLAELQAALAWLQAGAQSATTLALRLTQHPALKSLQERGPPADTSAAGHAHDQTGQARGAGAWPPPPNEAEVSAHSVVALAEQLSGAGAVQIDSARATLEGLVQHASALSCDRSR